MNKKITVRTGTIEEAAKEFVKVWHQIENGNAELKTTEKISFKNPRLLFKTLTPKRFEILKYIHSCDGTSIRSLAIALQRDYSNVHQDVSILVSLGLILKNANGLYVPWDVIVTEIPLTTNKIKRARSQNIPRKPRRAAQG